MYFSLKTVAGTPYLCLMQSTYVRGKHPKKTMIKRLGKLSELLIFTLNIDRHSSYYRSL